MSKIVLDTYPKEPKECPFCETHRGWRYSSKEYFCHLREGMDFDCKYVLKECVGCDKCEKITTLFNV